MSALPQTRPRGGVLTASALRAGDRDSEYADRKGATWQERALAYIDLVPEINFASRFYARMLRQVRFYPATLMSDGTLEEIKEGLPVERLAQIRDPGGGRSVLQGQYGRLMFSTGEGGLFGRDLTTPQERWSFVWSGEVKVEKGRDGQVTKIVHMPNGESGKKTEYGPSRAVFYPMWTPHPRLSGEADSPMRAVLDIAEELIILTKAVRATAVTRLTTDPLFMPSEASPGSATPDADDDPEEDPFASDLGAHMDAQVENFDEAAARSPLVVWMQGELIAQVKTVKLHDPATDYVERELRKEAIDRLGLGLDMPPEALSGVGQSNHWSAIQILGDMWKSHGINVAMQFASDIADVYLRPGLRDDGFEGWEDVVVGVDGSQVSAKVDRADDAKTGIEMGAIGPRGWRKMMNVPDDLAPDESEQEWMLELRGKTQPGQQGSAEPSQAQDAPGAPPPPGANGDSGRRTRVVAAAFREMGAAEYALLRSRELAGMRLQQKSALRALAAICLDCAEQAEKEKLSVVAAAIGPDRLAQLGVEPMALVKGGADTLRELLAGWGYPPAQAEALAQMVETYAARTLFEPKAPALPAGFEVQLAKTREFLDDVAA